MLGQKGKDIPVEKVLEMKRQGASGSDIISQLRDMGYKHEQISSAMDQADVKFELSNVGMPDRQPVNQNGEIPFGLMNAPSPSDMPSNESNSMPSYSPQDYSMSEGPSFAPEPLERSSYDAVEEIAESIIKEKWDDLLRNMGDIRLWKERTDIDLEGVKQELVRTQEKFENLQKAIMGRIKEYSEGVTSISSEMRALEKVLENILSPLTRSVRELQEVTEKVSKTRRRSSPLGRRKLPKRRVTRRKKRK